MTIACDLSVEQQQQLGTLRDAERLWLKCCFRELPPPKIDDFRGEFDAELLDQGGKAANRIVRWIFSVHGPWLGKAFNPITDSTGEGYNYFEQSGKSVRLLPMKTYVGNSSIAPGQSLYLDYRSTTRGPIRYLVGEVRQYSDTVFIGMGTWGPRIGKKDLWRRVIPFVMVGPMRPFHSAMTPPGSNTRSQTRGFLDAFRSAIFQRSIP